MTDLRSLQDATLVFDLDGTLVHTAPDIQRALNLVLARHGLGLAELEEVRVGVGLGARILIERSFAARGQALDDARLEGLTEAYTEAYASDIASMSRPFEGVEDVLDLAARAGARLCVCTNKRTGLSIQLLEALGLASRFAAIVGSDGVANRKPHADHFLATVGAAGGDPARALMIGDSAADVASARAASAPVVVYAHGYTDTAPELLGADAVFTQYSDLPDLAVRLLGRR
jgi:phosphoglycolate phosphatase